MQPPILYSLRNCPYAMRARIAIYKAKQKIELRDVVLSDKPPEMLEASPKGTVPVLVLPQEGDNARPQIIEESFEIMQWALGQSDPDNLLHCHDENILPQMVSLINQFDNEFKTRLEQYKSAKRYREANVAEQRQACEHYIQLLEQRLTQHAFLFSDKESFADIALVPFIRQFARVERQWYLQAPYPHLRQWLNNYLQSKMFSKVMAKYPLWLESRELILFDCN
ncbi:glutathione S-transferase [Psychrobium sp. 1_MG-2023]|uniref:glutathione S-transferase n=1 Tax=Psychrobium sp. 1_MG-2023 TaxID=3062624 RepID=UPI000C337B5F|nr:glutathione S-transferase [Psychrobium sp. 1_MG-2023]MDP2561595.1 glutathione S-transferase [Psychrobium sp. 1_MG-2023]PKF55616.1 glutathione S-transferase [Alteromonadales bacterium alter-6D02]